MTQRNLRGVYLTFAHDRRADWDFLAAWQPAVVHLMTPASHTDPRSLDVNRIRRVHEVSPTSQILMRVWDVDDRNYEAHVAMSNDPHAEAQKQVDWWAAAFDRVEGVPRELLLAGMNNETDPSRDAALYTYSENALQLGTRKGVRIGALVFSVGRPGLAGESEYDIARFSQLEKLFLAGNHVAVFNEYMQPEGRFAVWTDSEGRERKDYSYLIGRHKRWPTTIPKIIGEWGIEGILYNRHLHPLYGNNGWHSFPEWTPTRYADEYVACVVEADPSVIGTCPFLSDNGDKSGRWQSFDVMEAYGELMERKDLCVRDVSTQPSTVYIPNVSAPSVPVETKPMATNIIEPRVAQAILKIESGGRTHGEDGRIIIRFEPHVFAQYVTPEAFANHFQIGTPQWNGDQHRYRDDSGNFIPFHGNQTTEYRALNVALELNSEGALKSISMGAGQVMGFNHARVGFPTAAAMLQAFQDATMQTIGFMNYFLSDPGLMDAMWRKDWRTIAAKYNGAANVNVYAPLLERAYNELGG